MTEADKQIEAEARELICALLDANGILARENEWSYTSPATRKVWLRVAARSRELADARYKPLVDAAERFRDMVLHHQRGPLEEPCLDNDQTNAALAAFDDEIGSELDKLKGGQ